MGMTSTPTWLANPNPKFKPSPNTNPNPSTTYLANIQTRVVNGTRISRVAKNFPFPWKKNSRTRILGKCTVCLLKRWWHNTAPSAGTICLISAGWCIQMYSDAAAAASAASQTSSSRSPAIHCRFTACRYLRHSSRLQRAKWAVFRRWSTMSGVTRNRIKQSVIKSMQALLSPLSCSLTIYTASPAGRPRSPSVGGGPQRPTAAAAMRAVGQCHCPEWYVVVRYGALHCCFHTDAFAYALLCTVTNRDALWHTRSGVKEPFRCDRVMTDDLTGSHENSCVNTAV